MAAQPVSRLMPSPQLASGPHAAAGQEWRALMVAAQGGHGGAYQRLLTEIAAWLRRYFARRLPPGEVDDAQWPQMRAVRLMPPSGALSFANSPAVLAFGRR